MVREVTEDDTGLKVLREPGNYDNPRDELEIIDIVAIHGIGAHPDDTWCKNVSPQDKEKRYVNWLEQADMLPSVVPHARIIRYGYESQWFGDEQSSTVRLRASHIAEQLLNELTIERDACPYRALIFISHCFGGLVVLKALRQALDNEYRWPGVFPSTTGLVFFGTPFRGTEGMKQSDMLQAALSEYTTNVRSDSLRILAPGDEFLQEIVKRFLETRSRPHPATIACFYETKSSNVGAIVGRVARQEFVVNESSGCLDHTASIETYPLSRTHFDINKFGKPSESSYRVVSRAIRKMADAAPEILAIRGQIKSRKRGREGSPSDVRHHKLSSSMALRPVEAPQSTQTNQLHCVQANVTTEQTSQMHASSSEGHSTVSVTKARRQEYLKSLRFRQIDARHATIGDAHRRTCEWLLETSEYRDWGDMRKFHEHNGFLWIKGKPGTGKSTLMKYAFEHSKVTTSASDSIVISFFFTARGEYLERSTEGMYRSLLRQLLVDCPSLQAVLDTIPFPADDPKFTPEWTTRMTQTLLQRAIREPRARALIIFIDALDECDENEVRDMIDFFDGLEEKASFLMCFSSRHYPNITFERSIQLILENQDGHEQDMSSYLNDKFRAGHSRQVGAIKAEILERSSGIFLWVVLVVQVLNKEYDRGRLRALQRRLAEMPSGLEDLFVDILTRDNENIEELVLCLQWILYAERPLNNVECYLAISGETDSEAITAWNSEDITTEDIRRFILSSSKGLAEVTDSKPETVQFIHQSVRDFLLKDDGFRKIQTDLGDNSPSLSHDRLKRYCYTYITTVTAICSPSNLDGFPFLRYAVFSVFYHANQAQRHGVSQHDFLEHFPLETWIRLFNLMVSTTQSHLSRATMLYILAQNGYTHLVNIELGRTAHIDVNGGFLGFPLTVASGKGYREVVETLLRHGANASIKGGYYGTALQAACLGGHKDIVKLLLSHDADVNALAGYYGSAIQAASAEGFEDIVKLLLLNHADVNKRGGRYFSALHAAIENGQEHIVERLLSSGAKPNGTGEYYGSGDPLYLAAKNGEATIVQILLDYGANVNTQGSIYGSALTIAAEQGHYQAVNLLLENDADVNTTGGFYHTALQAAACSGKPEAVHIVEDLLLSGAEVNAQGGKHGTALNAALHGGHLKVAELLRDYGAAVNAESARFDTALNAAVCKD